ncbi:arylsulfatase A-like enzyme [Pseudoduganella lurida]|uniref:Arylsulfatase A-like enzyme n=1 Tax=Pseudoduganella lurida TaxID=1036180 RepID=A0A562R8N8_9BURK|nr:arylsulfatase [Pseudoduganella lurida]TWI65421.1 arylsulfatase A-like enzyme [Pseudoduganella lurida]
MIRREFIISTLAAIATAPAFAAPQPGTRRPNIIFILADDMGWGDTAIYGSTKIRTPNIDRLAKSGMLFTQGYAGAPVCGPSRCALMTGQHTGHARIRDNTSVGGGRLGTKGKGKELWRRPNLLPEDHTVAQYLQGAGYRTGLMGKWHLDGFEPNATPPKFGFDEFKGWLIQQESTQGYWPSQRMHNEKLVDIPENANGKHGLYEPNILTEDALDFIERNKAGPFFLFAGYNSPHSPYTAPDFGPYADKAGWADDEKTYAAMIHYLDVGIGKLLDKLAAAGLDKDTVIFFASDNGPRSEPTAQQTRLADFFDSNGGLTGYKRDMYEGGIRDPWIVSWPGRIPAGAVSDVPVYFPDFLPTALDLAGAAAAKTDGVSLKPFLVDPQRKAEDRLLYWEYYDPEFRQAARWGKWKAVRLKRNGALELYDLSVDPKESRNVAAQHPEIVAKIAEGMAREHVASVEYPDPAPKAGSKES